MAYHTWDLIEACSEYSPVTCCHLKFGSSNQLLYREFGILYEGDRWVHKAVHSLLSHCTNSLHYCVIVLLCYCVSILGHVHHALFASPHCALYNNFLQCNLLNIVRYEVIYTGQVWRHMRFNESHFIALVHCQVTRFPSYILVDRWVPQMGTLNDLLPFRPHIL